MAQVQRSLLTVVVLLVAAGMVRTAPNEPLLPQGGCRDHICLNDYRGDGTNVDFCELKARLVKYCPPKNDLCLAAPCEERKECLDKRGFCVSEEGECFGRTIPGLCEGHECFCCITEDGYWPIEEYIEPSVSVCSGTVSLMADDRVGIYSPDFPIYYGNDINCTLKVVLLKRVKVKMDFLYFDLGDCQSDNLTITAGESGAVLGGSSLPGTTELFTNLTMMFQTDSSIRGPGFYISLETELWPYNICDHGTISVTDYDLLVSPNHPSSYPPDVTCSAVITGPVGSRFILDWQFFEVESSAVDSSCLDYVQIYDTNSPSTNLYCGTSSPSFMKSVTNEVKIIFSSNYKNQQLGFKVLFTVV